MQGVTDAWLRKMIENGTLCKDYQSRVADADGEGRFGLFRIISDSNGISWVPELMMQGMVLPIEEYKAEYEHYLNGECVVRFPKGYTSKTYVDYSGEITADTTLLGIIRCKADITIPDCRWPRIVVSPDSDIRIAMGRGSRLTLDVYGNATYSISGDSTRVRIQRHEKDNGRANQDRL